MNQEHHAIPFDTLAYAKKLMSVGVSDKQAEIQAETLAELVNDQMVSKQYLDLRLKEIKSEIVADVIKWVAGMLVGQAIIIAALIKLL